MSQNPGGHAPILYFCILIFFQFANPLVFAKQDPFFRSMINLWYFFPGTPRGWCLSTNEILVHYLNISYLNMNLLPFVTLVYKATFSTVHCCFCTISSKIVQALERQLSISTMIQLVLSRNWFWSNLMINEWVPALLLGRAAEDGCFSLEERCMPKSLFELTTGY